MKFIISQKKNTHEYRVKSTIKWYQVKLANFYFVFFLQHIRHYVRFEFENVFTVRIDMSISQRFYIIQRRQNERLISKLNRRLDSNVMYSKNNIEYSYTYVHRNTLPPETQCIVNIVFKYARTKLWKLRFWNNIPSRHK